MRQARWHGCQGLEGVHAAAQDLHENITVKSLERMATCTVRVLPVHDQRLVFAGGQQPDLAVEVCIKQHTGALLDARCIGRGETMGDSADARMFEELMGVRPRLPAGHACLAYTLTDTPAGALPLRTWLL